MTANSGRHTCRCFIMLITLISPIKGELHPEVFNGHFRLFQVTGLNAHFKVIKRSYPIKHMEGNLGKIETYK